MIWGKNEISTRLEEITGSKNDPTNLTWDVVESLPVSEIIKTGSDFRDYWSIAMRYDHGQNYLDDHGRNAVPGYPAIGRLKGLAELGGVTKKY